jgi:hypothetical protein
MIHVDLPASMDCAEKDCGARLGIKLCLTLGGTFAARPPSGHGWQLIATQQGVIVCRCPAHHSKIDVPPEATLRDVLANGARH